MELEEAKVLVKKELETIGKFFGTSERVARHTDHYSFTSDEIDVSIQVFSSEWQEYTNVYLSFEFNGLDYDIISFNATPQSIAKLFAEYKRIKGE